MKPSRVVVVGTLVVLVGAAFLAREIRDDPDLALAPFVTAPVPGDARIVTPTLATTTAVDEPAPPRLEATIPHTLDPCTELRTPKLPANFPSVTIDGITIAWDPSVTIETTTLAYLTAGLLAQGAQLLGTSTRPELSVVVYATAADLVAQTHAPAWAGGLYDGAVRIPAHTSSEVGVPIATLRHEIMHALLHAEVGCMPAWLDEGLAQYFAHETRDVEWLRMLAGAPVPTLAAMQVASIVEVNAVEPEPAYAQSLAMTLFAIERHTNIPELLRDLRRGAPLELWKRLFPAVNDRDVLEALSLRMLGLPLGHAQAEMLADGVCCTHDTGVAVTCTAAHARPNSRKYWFEDHHPCQAVN